MKAVGQLFVYEKVLGQSYHKVMVLPEIVPDLYRELVDSLGIEVVEYRKAGTGHVFKWRKGL
ncbi:hypothetical protein DFR52_106269 [Hoeflea marina]|uniref:Uncharacterized protein n=1 Tax=Hoeflea marina TaxID=274592 RepID=A0A317PG15_9HYPH|nr:hypothetical protein [Hoeflea marina]PWV97744.1 hypothetical protein DFR52_106269 [Hoeflea marina]